MTPYPGYMYVNIIKLMTSIQQSTLLPAKHVLCIYVINGGETYGHRQEKHAMSPLVVNQFR